MPPFPIFIIVIGPLLLLALCVWLGVRKVVRARQKREQDRHGQQAVGMIVGQHYELPVENGVSSEHPLEAEKLEAISA